MLKNYEELAEVTAQKYVESLDNDDLIEYVYTRELDWYGQLSDEELIIQAEGLGIDVSEYVSEDEEDIDLTEGNRIWGSEFKEN